MLNVVSEFDVQSLIDRHLNPTYRKPSAWVVFSADAAIDVHDTYEYISELRNEIKGISAHEKAQVLLYINQLEPKLNELMELMYGAGFEPHYYDKLWFELRGIQKEIPKIREQLGVKF